MPRAGSVGVPKATRKQRAQTGVTKEELLSYLSNRWRRARKPDEKQELAMQLLPYFAPRLKAVEAHVSHNVVVEVEIGGDE